MGDPLMIGSMLWQKREQSQDNCLHGIRGLVEGLTFHYHSMQTTQPNRLLRSLGEDVQALAKRVRCFNDVFDRALATDGFSQNRGKEELGGR